MKLRAIVPLAVVLFLCHPGFSMDCPIGWAAVNALGQNGTTGGGNGPVVPVSTLTDLANYAGLSGPYTILVSGSFTNASIINVASHKTIIGVGAGATLDGIGLSLNTQSNVIIRNLTIRNVVPTDAFAARTSHHIWLDHCDLSACGDALADFTVGSEYITVSWTKLHNHDKVSLVNGGTSHFEDVGKCKATYHHNWFADTVQRNPRVGYGLGHVFNNYYTNISSYCVGYHSGASVLVESNYFLKSATPLNQMYTSNPWEFAYADSKSVGNIFDTCTGNTTATGNSFDPEFYYNYKFALDAAGNIPLAVKGSGGPSASIVRALCPTPGNGAIDVFTETNSLIWTDLEGTTNWDVYFGTTVSPSFQTNKATRTFSPGVLAANADYYWQVDARTTNGIVTGEVWRFRTALTNAAKPFPANNELHASLLIPNTDKTMKPLELTWTPGIGVVSNQIYFGTNATLTGADLKSTVTSPLYAPGMLQFGQTYYWRVDTVKSGGITVTGAVWNFKSDLTNSTTGRTETENMVRCGRYFREVRAAASGGWDVQLEGGTGTASPGTVSSVWAGPNAICNVNIAYLDQSGGTGWFALYVNGTKISEWFASANDDLFHTNLISNVALNTGDEVRIGAYSDVSELSRVDFMDVAIVSGPPAAPAGLTATPGNALVWLSWTASAGATNYYVKRSTTSGSGYVTIATNATTSFVNTGLVNGTTYYYVVSSLGVFGEGDISPQVSATPAAYWPTTKYKSNGTGGGNWGTLGTWQMSTNGGSAWVAATVLPSSVNDTIQILTNDTVTISDSLAIDQVTVDQGAQLSVTAEVTTVTNGTGTDLNIYGTFLIPAGNTTASTITLANNASVVVQTNGVIQSQYGSTTDPFSYGSGSAITNYGTYKMKTIKGTVPTCKWQTGSTLEISPAVDGGGSAPASGMGQSFYNVVYNLSGQSSDMGASGGLTTILGDLTFTSTSGRYLSLVGAANQTLTISGNVNINGTSKVNLFSFSSGSPASTVNFQKSLTVAATAALGVNNKNYTTSQNVKFIGTGTINLGLGVVAENTGGAVDYTVSGNYALAHDWRLNSIAGLLDTLTVSGTLDCSTFNITNNSVGGNNTFTLNSGATLRIGSTNGITTSGATGNIQVSGTRSFNTAANYFYNGTAAQVTGNGLPATVSSLTTSNTTALAVSQSVTATNLKVSASTTLDFNGNTITTPNAPILSGGLKMKVAKSGGGFTGSKLIQTAGTLAYGGTLSITNTGNSLAGGDVIDLFDAPAFNGGSSFSAVTCPSLLAGQSLSLAGLSVNGSLLVNQSPTGPGYLTNRISNSTLTLTWPTSQGWRLVGQTNNLSVGLTPDGWGGVSGGIDGSNSITINPTKPAVFYRLTSP